MNIRFATVQEWAKMERPFLQIAKFPRNAACAVTTSWDDNGAGNLEIMKILDSFGLKGTFYIDPGNSREDGLTDAHIKALAANNEVGSHTWSHKNLRHSDAKTIREEIITPKQYIENITGTSVFGLAYPWGDHSPLSEKLVRECGYLFARTVDEGNVRFPPSNPYAWGISVHALEKPRLISRRAHVYVKNLTSDWSKLARTLFVKSRRTQGVWHLFGHAGETLGQPGSKNEFLKICEHVARRDDVWYATNGMPFLNEALKKNTHVTWNHRNGRDEFDIQVKPRPQVPTEKFPVPLLLTVPKEWNNNFNVEVLVQNSQRFQIGRIDDGMWIDVFGYEGKVILTR